MIRSRYASWMNDWEYRLETRDSNRVVRPFDWGLDWTADFPGVYGGRFRLCPPRRRSRSVTSSP